MLSIRKVSPAVRVLAMTMICALCLVWVGAIQQRSNAIAGSLLLGAAGAAAAGSILPVVIGGTLLLALGVAFINRDALITAAGRLGADLGDLFDRDMAASTVVQEPATGQYKLKTRIGDDTWSAARSWVAQEYDPGDVTEGDSDFFLLPISSLVNGSYSNLDSCYVSPSDMVSALQNVRLNACIDYFNIDLSAVNFMVVRMESNSTTHCQIFAFDSAYLKYSNGSFRASDGTSIVPWTSYQIWGDNLQYHSQYTDSTGIGVIGSDYSFLYNLGSYSAGASVGSAAPDIVDNPAYDYRNARSGAREIVVPLVAAAAGTANPDVSIDEDDKRKWVVPDVGIDNLVGAHPADVPAQDVGGVQVDEGVQVDSDAKTDVQTATDAAAADETQSSLAGLFFSKFPFCIPFDVLQAFKLIAVPAVAPYFEWDGLSTLPIEWVGSTKIVFDMGEERWQIVGQICRWTSLVGFCLALMLGTRRLMKW